jgi:hypothetical protein
LMLVSQNSALEVGTATLDIAAKLASESFHR